METQAVKLNQLYASPACLGQLFNIGSSHIYQLLKVMRNDKVYKDYVVSYGKVTRVKITKFEEFWREYAKTH